MKTISVHCYDAFSDKPGMGNPAGIVLEEGQNFSDAERQEIARLVGFNETVFITASERADLKMRYFTPGHETALCGHATIGGISFMRAEGRLPDSGEIRLETNAGLLSVELSRKNGLPLVGMEQLSPEFVPFSGDKAELCHVLGIEIQDLHPSLPIVYGSTGSWTLLVPLAGLDSFSRMRPLTQEFPGALTQKPRSSIHPTCFQARKPGMQVHSRHFSSPYSGTVEDAVTGTASGVIGGYYATHLAPQETVIELAMEQGHEIGRDGEVFVQTRRENAQIRIKVSGTATPTEARTLQIN